MSGFSNFYNTTGQSLTQSGPTAKKIDGDSFSTQTGNATSLQYGNKNVYQRGLTDNLFAGLTFTTNAAGVFSTTLGFTVSTQLGATVSTSLGAKATLNAALELMVNFQRKYTVAKMVETNAKVEEVTVAKRKTHFAEDYQAYINQKQETAVSVTQNVSTADLTFGEVTTTVAGDDMKAVQGSHQVLAESHSFVSPLGSTVKIGGNIVMNGNTLNFSGTTINLG
jgi:hypothetical protein